MISRNTLCLQHEIDQKESDILPAANCCSDVAGRALSSCKDLSAAFLNSGFLRLASEERAESSLVSSVALIVVVYFIVAFQEIEKGKGKCCCCCKVSLRDVRLDMEEVNRLPQPRGRWNRQPLSRDSASSDSPLSSSFSKRHRQPEHPQSNNTTTSHLQLRIPGYIHSKKLRRRYDTRQNVRRIDFQRRQHEQSDRLRFHRPAEASPTAKGRRAARGRR